MLVAKNLRLQTFAYTPTKNPNGMSKLNKQKSVVDAIYDTPKTFWMSFCKENNNAVGQILVKNLWEGVWEETMR